MNSMGFAVVKTADGVREQLAVYATRKEAVMKSFAHGMAEMRTCGIANMRYSNISGVFLALSKFGAVVFRLTVEAVIVSEVTA